MTTGWVRALPLTILVAIAAACMLTLFLPITAAAQGPGTCTFSGIVTLDNAQVADDTLVTAIIAGDEYQTYTPTEYGYSTYSLTISASEGKDYPDGTKVTFTVDGYAANQTGIFQAGADIRLDLKALTSGGAQDASASEDTSSAASLRTRLLVFVVFALLVAAGIGYSFVRRRENRRVMMSIRDRYARAAYSSLEESSKQALLEPSVIDQQLRTADTGGKTRFEQPINYPEGVKHALAVHGFDLQGITPVNMMVWCPACRERFQIWVPSNWSVTRSAHAADGEPNYAKRTRTKWLFEFDVECDNGHRLHLDWTWKERPNVVSYRD